MTDPSLEEVVFDAPFHEVIVEARPGHPFKLGDRGLVISLKRGKICDLEEELVRKGFSVVALIPLRSCVVGLLFLLLARTYTAVATLIVGPRGDQSLWESCHKNV